MNTRCYFDMLDNCVAYENKAVGFVHQGKVGEALDILDSGMYNLPHNLNPIGMSAAELYDYSKSVTLTEHVW